MNAASPPDRPRSPLPAPSAVTATAAGADAGHHPNHRDQRVLSVALDLVWVLVGLILTVGTGFFVASEFALVNLDRNDLESRQKRGESGLGLTINALKITSTHLSGAQLGITLTTLLTGYTMEPAISRLLAGPADGGLGCRRRACRGSAPSSGVAFATLLSMVLGELVPKNFALALPLATAKVVVPFQTFFTTVFRPLIALFNNTANAVIRGHGDRAQGGAVRCPVGRGAQLAGSSVGDGGTARRRPRHAAQPDAAVLRPLRRGRDDAPRTDDEGAPRRHGQPRSSPSPSTQGSPGSR